MSQAPVTRRTVGSWEIHDVIGSGSFAIVWKARHVETGALSAVKEILADRLNKKLYESLESEIAVLQRLKHTNIVGLLDLYKEPGKIYLVLEYCGGGDLSQHLRQRGPLSEASCRYLLRQLAEGLKVLRQHNVIHRDLKPQNLLLSDNGPSPTLKIADFGFARSLQPAGLAETLCGSPLYMAPEVLQLNRYDAKADLWSVGTILFELLTGKPPFSGANHYQLVQNIERGDAAVPEHIARNLSPGCRQLLHQLLRRYPVERISFDELFAHPFLGGEAASAAVAFAPGGGGAFASASLGGALAGPAASAATARAPAGYGASNPQPVGVPRRYTPTSQGAVRFVQPVRSGSPVHPAFQIPSPSPSSSLTARQPSGPQSQLQCNTQPASARPGAGATSAAPSADGSARATAAAQGGPADGPAAAAAAAAATATAAVAPAVPIAVRELTRSPSPRIIAAAAAVASALVQDVATPPAGIPAGTLGSARPAGTACAGAPPAEGAPVGLSGSTGDATSSASSASHVTSSGRPLADSLDSDYVVVSSPSAAARAQVGAGAVLLSPRTPHPAMTGGRASRAGSTGGGGGGAALPGPTSTAAPGGLGAEAGAAAAAGKDTRQVGGPTAAPPAPVQPAWQQLLAPIAAATMPSNHGTPYTISPHVGLPAPRHAGLAPEPVSGAAAAAGLTAAQGAAAPGGATVTIRLPAPGGPADSGEGGDPALLPRVVGVLMDHARSRCTALLDADEEARQLGDRHAGMAGSGYPDGCEHGGLPGAAGAEMADEAAAAMGTLLVACRLLLAALSAAGGKGAQGSSGGGCGGGKGDANGPCLEAAMSRAGGCTQAERPGSEAGAPCGPGASPTALAAPSPPPPSAEALAALAAQARSVLATLDQHLHGTVARLLLDAVDPRSGPVGTVPRQQPGPPCAVPCGLDALLAAAVHHSRAAAGEELLGNAAGAVEQYGRAADLLLFLLAAPPSLPGAQQQQQQQHGVPGGYEHAGGGDGGSPDKLLEAVRPPLPPLDRQRLTKYYAAVRLRQTAALASMGPSAAAAGAALPSHHHHHAHPAHHLLRHQPHVMAPYPPQRSHEHTSVPHLDGRRLGAGVGGPTGPMAVVAGQGEPGGMPYGYDQVKGYGGVVF